jgi:pimeloyl-ACP methyl ester carboxylesterase
VARPQDIGRVIEIPGPWQHRNVAANGARFHVAEADPGTPDAPLVLMLHGFPEFWWSWRAQLPVLAEAGYRAVAMDLRGYGGSDKTPRGYDPFTLAQDVAGVVKSLGERSAVLVGHGWGGYVGWATAVLHPAQVSALCAVSAPHPLTMLHSATAGWQVGALKHVLRMQLPMRPERRLADPDSGFLRDHMRGWSAPGSQFPDDETVATYQSAISLWPASHCALEYHRWLFRSRLRTDGRRFNETMGRPVTQPVCCVSGDSDPALPATVIRGSRSRVLGGFTEQVLSDVGHFPHEERPQQFNELLLEWLRQL